MGIWNAIRSLLGSKDPQINYEASRALAEYGNALPEAPRSTADMYLKDANGELVDPDDPDDLAVPHVYTFGSIIAGAAYTYMHGRHDEAMKHSRENALRMRRDPFIMALLRERKLRVMRQKWHLETDDIMDESQKLSLIHISEPTRLLSISYAVF